MFFAVILNCILIDLLSIYSTIFIMAPFNIYMLLHKNIIPFLEGNIVQYIKNVIFSISFLIFVLIIWRVTIYN